MTPNNAWKRLKRLDRQHHHNNIKPLQDGRGGRAYHDRDKAGLLGTKFFIKDSHPLEAGHHQMINVVKTWLNQHPAEAQFSPPVTREEVTNAILKMRELAAPGWDEIMDVVLRHTSEHTTPLLTAITQSCLSLQFFPSHWKRARTIALPKTGKPADSIGGYRPIALLSVLGKAVEGIMNQRLSFWLEYSHKLHEAQFGFRRHRGTEIALWNFAAAATTAMQ